MKKLFKLFIITLALISSVNISFGFSSGKVDKLITNSKLNDTATIAISIRNVSNNNVVFEKNQNKLLHPASTIKLVSTYYSINTLGYEYSFKTGFYIDSNNNLYIKLGADPSLTTAQLKTAFQCLKDKGLTSFNNIYFDDSIIDKKEFSNGWMWDDDINPYTPKVSAYNLDSNIIRVNLNKDVNGNIKADYKNAPISVYTNISSDSGKDYLDFGRYNWNSPDVVEIYGNLRNSRTVNIPISSMRRYFIWNIEKIIDDYRFNIKSTKYASRILPDNTKLIYEISNSVKPAVYQTLQRSNNLTSETLFKLASSSQYNATGTDERAIIGMKDFYKKLNIKFDDVQISDGCGISRLDLISADWMSDTLNKIYNQKNFEAFKNYMAQPGDGTLSNRLFDLRGDAWLKTGSLSGISSIAGYISSLDGNTYSVSILIQNFKQDSKEIKKFEDEIITLIYNQ